MDPIAQKRVLGIPFKKKSENGGVVDPRMNKGGRPKLIFEETAKYLARKSGGKTNAQRLVESMGALAQQQLPHSVSAFKELRQTAEPTVAETGENPIQNLSLTLVQVLQQAAVAQGEKRVQDTS